MTGDDAASRLAQEVARTCPAMRSRALSRAIAKIFDDAFRDLSIKSTQFAVLIAIEASGSCRPMDIADELSLSRAATTRALDVLEKRGWVRSTEKAATSRTLEVTPAGKALLLDAEPRWRAAADRVNGAIASLPSPRALLDV